ncbi:30S ribosomal protein S11 [symbiont of Argiope bruennichi]|uniref:30S ribosomal protein S11 n=1 Tax=symbiont of Argiope bruennichi TaxID=2810479 RepID=UPI003DA2980F
MANNRLSSAKKKKKISLNSAIVHIRCSFNNTIIVVTNEDGKVVTWASAGSCGFKGTKKGTPYAGQQAAIKCCNLCIEFGVKEMTIFLIGIGPGRDSSLRTFQSSGIKINKIKDHTPIPFNGCKLSKSQLKNKK